MPLAMPMGRFLWDVAPLAERVQGLGSCVLYAAVRRVLLTYLLTLGVPCLRLGSWHKLGFVFFTSRQLDRLGGLARRTRRGLGIGN